MAASAAGAVLAQPASAANGGAVLLGKGNSATLGTSIAAVTSAPGITVNNTGSGAAGAFTSTAANGFACTSKSGSHWGFVAANSATTYGGGGAFVANGGVSTGGQVATGGANVSALIASHVVPLSSVTGNEAALNAYGRNAHGVISTTTNPDGFAVMATHYGGGTAIVGSCDGGLGLMGIATGGGSGVYALADDPGSTSITASGPAMFLDDVVVMGTLYAPNVVNGLPAAGDVATAASAGTARSGPAAKVAARAARTAARIRVAQATA